MTFRGLPRQRPASRQAETLTTNADEAEVESRGGLGPRNFSDVPRKNFSVRGTENISDYLQKVVAANGSQKETARVLCISPQYLCDILAGRREISAEVAELLGYERVVTYRLLEAATKPAAVDPHGDSNTGTPSTREVNSSAAGLGGGDPWVRFEDVQNALADLRLRAQEYESLRSEIDGLVVNTACYGLAPTDYVPEKEWNAKSEAEQRAWVDEWFAKAAAEQRAQWVREHRSLRSEIDRLRLRAQRIEALEAENKELKADAARVHRLPELEWAKVGAAILPALAVLAKTNHELAKNARDYVDKGQTYVARLRAEKDAAEAQLQISAQRLLEVIAQWREKAEFQRAWALRRPPDSQTAGHGAGAGFAYSNCANELEVIGAAAVSDEVASRRSRAQAARVGVRPDEWHVVRQACEPVGTLKTARR